MINKTLNGMKYILFMVLLITAAVVFTQCSNEQSKTHNKAETENDAHSDEEHAEEVVTLSDEELKEFGIELATAGPGLLQQHVDLTGEIVIDPDRLAHIYPRFPGIVKDVRKKIGDRVKKNEVLAVIESNESLSPYEVTSLIDGTVIEMHLTKGEVISNASHDIVIADLSYVWADLNVYQKDLQYIETGQSAIISGGVKMPEGKGKISYISPVVNEATRTAVARVILPNADGRWRPGLFVSARAQTEKNRADIVVPKTALETFEGNTVVFVQTKDDFVPQPVETGLSNLKMVEIRRGLQAGWQYVAKNGFTLKAELQKESFGGGHAH